MTIGPVADQTEGSSGPSAIAIPRLAVMAMTGRPFVAVGPRPGGAGWALAGRSPNRAYATLAFPPAGG